MSKNWNIIINNEDYGQYENLTNDIASAFRYRIDLVVNIINTTTFEEEVATYINNATTIHYTDVLPDTCETNTICSIIDVSNQNIYGYINGTMTLLYEIPLKEDTDAVEIVPVLPTTNISMKHLYKLTKDMTHEGTIAPKMISKAYSESETPQEGIITHNLTTDKWYDGLNEIEIQAVTLLPEASVSNFNQWFLNNESLYHCELYTPIIVDYVAGLYAYEASGWKIIYSSSPTLIDWETIRKDTLPTIQGVLIDGNKSITDFDALTEQLGRALFQPKNMDNPPAGYVATSVEGVILEMDSKYSTAMRIKGDVNYYDLLPTTDLSAGDMYVVKKLYAYYNSTTDKIIGVLQPNELYGYYDGSKEENLVEITWSGSDIEYNGNTYTRDSSKDVAFNNIYAWNGVNFFKFGSSEIDMSPYQKFEQVLPKFIIANPAITFNQPSSIAKNDNFIIARIDATLNTPITNIQSQDIKLLDAPSDVPIRDGYVNLYIKTHQGTMTATENVPLLPSGGDSDFLQNVFDPTKIHEYNIKTKKTCSIVTSITGIGYEYNETNTKYYKDGEEITVNDIAVLPEPSLSEDGNYYHETGVAPEVIWLYEKVWGAEQDFNIVTGNLLYTKDGMPQFLQTQKTDIILSSNSSVEVFVLDVDNMTYSTLNNIESWIIGYKTEQTAGALPSKQVDVPIYRLKQITLTSNEEYIEACKRKRSGLNVNASGVYGYYTITESDESKKYSQHGALNGKCRDGFNGTWSFTPAQNNSQYQPTPRAYWSNNKLYVSGGMTIDGFIFVGVL